MCDFKGNFRAVNVCQSLCLIAYGLFENQENGAEPIFTINKTSDDRPHRS